MVEGFLLYQQIIYILNCCFHGIIPAVEKLKEEQVKRIYAFSKQHSISAMLCMALENTEMWSGLDPEFVRKWKEDKEKAIRKNVMLDSARKEMGKAFSENNIWYIPLKGSVLKTLYPRFGMRQMADNDILFDSARQTDVTHIMKQLGYEVVSVGAGNHDIYHKEPIYNFELHTALFGEVYDEQFGDYTNHVVEHSIVEENGTTERRFTDEDFYVYMTAHTYKHFSQAGTGLRSLIDQYVYLSKKEGSMDWTYIQNELEQMQLSEFESCFRGLAKKIFANISDANTMELSDEEMSMFMEIVDAGTYGKESTRIKKSLQKISGSKPIRTIDKIKYLKGRFWPERAWFIRYIPICKKHPWIIPFYRWKRIVVGFCTRFRAILHETMLVNRTKE